MKNKVIIITGASSGIGKACVEKFAAEGAIVVMAARNADKLNVQSEALKKQNVQHLAVIADVSVEQDCQNIIQSAYEKFGRIDVLLNNAGISMRALVGEVNTEVIKKVMDTNFWGTVFCTRYALPYLLKSRGSVVGVSSIAGKKGLPTRSGYSASKFAMEGFLESLRIEHLKDGLHVLLACPGFTASNIRYTALSKDGHAEGESPRNETEMMRSEEVAQHIYTAVIKRKRDLILTAEGKLIVFINKFLPALGDKLVYSHFAKEKKSPLKG